ncbi:MAG: hypothetical protein GIW95_06010 [Candidatus Eremiobacteraeota bacterium]|nr:hypothetical protein [Candidatus Eremiobacteraeota bacterium]
MNFESIDRYLLGEPVSKADAVAAALGERADVPAAAPFYRALEAVGVRAADEALIALRLVLAGRSPDDASVRRLRALSALARAATNGDAEGARKTLKRDASALPEAATFDPGNLTALRERARAAFAAEVNGDQAAGGLR